MTGNEGDHAARTSGGTVRETLRESRHLVRAALLLAAGVLLFLVVRAILVPKGFGELGHFRTGALADNSQRPLAFAGSAACAECHADVVETRKGGKHENVGCEACHGALAGHAADPSTAPPRPDPDSVCLVCHLGNVAKPSWFPQVDPKEHGGGGACGDCHKPHNPGIG